MNILYLISKILTYPGAFMKGFWEHCTCRILRLPVTSRSYLLADSTCGHAVHVPAATPAKAFLLSWLPYVAQRILAYILLGASVGPLLVFGLRGQSETYLFVAEAIALFLGVSLFCNSFPQWDDAKRHWRLFYGKITPEEQQAALEAAAAEQAALQQALAEADEAAEDEPVDEAAEEEITEGASEENFSEEEAAEEEAAAEEAAEESAAFESLVAAVAAEESSEAGEEDEDEDEDEDDEEEQPPMIVVPKFARLPAKIILAPANAFFLAGAWLEHLGIPVYLSFAAAIALLIIRS